MRVSCFGDQNNGGAHLRDAGSEPRRVVAVGGAGVAGNTDDDEHCGCQNSGEVELVTSRHGEGRAGVLRAPASALKTMACSVAAQRGCGHDGNVRWRRRASALMAMVVRGRGRGREEGETGQ